MSFNEAVQQKIAARQLGGSGVKAAADALRKDALERNRAIHDAVLEMVHRLAESPIFAAGFGHAPEVQFDWTSESFYGSGNFELEGVPGRLLVGVLEYEPVGPRPTQTTLTLKIYPNLSLEHELGCGWSYAEATPVKGTPGDLPSFIAAAEDMIAEFLADVATSPVASKFLPGFRADNE